MATKWQPVIEDYARTVLEGQLDLDGEPQPLTKLRTLSTAVDKPVHDEGERPPVPPAETLPFEG